MKPTVKRSSQSTDSFVVRLDVGGFDQLFDAEDKGVGFLEFNDVKRGYVISPGLAIEGVTTASK